MHLCSVKRVIFKFAQIGPEKKCNRYLGNAQIEVTLNSVGLPLWYCIVLHVIALYHMVLHGIALLGSARGLYLARHLSSLFKGSAGRVVRPRLQPQQAEEGQGRDCPELPAHL